MSSIQGKEAEILIRSSSGNPVVAIPVESTVLVHQEKNYTDPIVCHDPSIKPEGIVVKWADQNKFYRPGEDNASAVNEYDDIRIDAIEYPLIVINNRNIDKKDILYMRLDYNGFLPQIYLEIFDEHLNEQKLNTTQMSGLIRVCMTSPVDKVYKKILLNFRITDAFTDETKLTNVTYTGEYYVEKFRQTNIGNIYMPAVCPYKYCQQGGHINANTWEMLHRIAEETGLGFAATRNTKEIKDHVVRNIHTQRYDKYIIQQLEHSGLGSSNIFDAWVDLYGYIVLVNVKWVMDIEIQPDDLIIDATTGIHATSNDTLQDQKPETVERTLTNHNFTGVKSNAEIYSYHLDVSNDIVRKGTLEHIYKVSIGGTKVAFDEMDIQVKQDSIDGQHIEDYNTGKSRPIPVFNFNDPAYTGFDNGYNVDEQKKIRSSWFKKKRQSVLNVVLRSPNFGLQRGTLVNLAIYELDPVNKQIMFDNTTNLATEGDDVNPDEYALPPEIDKSDVILDNMHPLINFKLSGLYYIDGMKWEYERGGVIVQTLMLIKKGNTTGYLNKHNPTRITKIHK